MEEREKSLKKAQSIFPFEDFRSGQKQIIRISQRVFSNEEVGLLHAPTGLGKTAAALTGFFSLGNDHPFDHLFALSRTKSQSKIYIEELEKIRNKNTGNSLSYSVLRSKKDLCILKRQREELQDLSYGKFLRTCSLLRLRNKCPFFRKSYDSSLPSQKLNKAVKWTKPKGRIYRLFKAGRRFHVCPYEITKHLIPQVRVTVCSFNYIFAPDIRENLFSSTGLSFHDIQFIIDEAHSLPEFISNLFSHSLSTYAIQKAKKEIDKTTISTLKKRDLRAYLSRFPPQINKLARDSGALSNLSSPKIIEKDKISYLLDLDMIEKLSEAGKEIAKRGQALLPNSILVADFLKQLMKIIDHERYALTVKCHKSKRGNLYKNLCFNLIDPSLEAKAIFERMNGSLLLSGSFYPQEYYKTVLGLDTKPLQEQTVTKILPSEFLRERRKIILDLTTTTKYEKRNEKTFRKIVERIKGVTTNLPEEKAALIVFPSYSMKAKIKNRLTIKRPIFDEKKDTKLEPTLAYMKTHPSTVVLAVARGKLTEGIDFRKEGETLLAAVILVGLPFPKFNELTKFKQAYFDKRVGKNKAFYLTTIAPAIRASIQAGGRLIRDKEDFGIIVILEKRFTRYGKYFPENWKEPYLVRRQRGLEAEASSFFRIIKQKKNRE